MNRTRLLFPALRCRMGDTIYYVTYLTFQDVVEWIKPTDEIHRSKKLSDWIQRQLIKGHADTIAAYLLQQKERFFNALVVGIYAGKPSWAPLAVTSPPADLELTDEDREMLSASVGILVFEGTEKVFAIDGQHRVAGIKKAVEKNEEIKSDEIVALFLGHAQTKAGERRTRRLFTTLNKTARRVSDADRIALDEDDGFAIVTRRMVDDFDLFERGKIIAFTPSGALPQADDEHLTTVINLYHQLRDLYVPRLADSKIKKAEYTNGRPPDDSLDAFFKVCCRYWTHLRDTVPELKEVFEGTSKPGKYRALRKNHLLMRPVGQRAFAGATGTLVARGATIHEAIKRLVEANLWIHDQLWHDILWDPTQHVMLKSAPLAETFLLHQINEPGRTANRTTKLSQVLDAREE